MWHWIAWGHVRLVSPAFSVYRNSRGYIDFDSFEMTPQTPKSESFAASLETPMTLNQHIDELISQRQSRLPLLNRLLHETEVFSGLLAATSEEWELNATHIPAELRKEADQIAAQLTKASLRLKSLHERFGRPYLTIVSFGKARQGKSRQLQSITGLTDEVVPTGDKGHCTASLIDVRHSPDKSHANIVTYTETDFLRERVAPFFDDLGVPRPDSLAEFSKMTLPRIEQFLGTKKNTVSQVMAGRYEMLQKLHASLPAVCQHSTVMKITFH